jgi:UDP-2,3-diacylglucosamine hydrolase
VRPLKTVGLIAGAGELPLLFAARARQAGLSLKIAALHGEASPRLARFSDTLEWISIGQLGKLIAFFKKEKVHQALMHGRVRHGRLFSKLRFDLKALALLARAKNRSGEALLKEVAKELGRNGVRLMDARFLMDDFLVPRGILTKKKPSSSEQATVRYGLEAARQLARVAVGQTLLLKAGAVVAVEAVEGTNQAIVRAGALAGKGVVLIKTASPRQDWRFDIPTIGLKTLEHLAKINAAGLVVEARKTFLLEKEEVAAFADRSGLFIQAV